MRVLIREPLFRFQKPRRCIWIWLCSRISIWPAADLLRLHLAWRFRLCTGDGEFLQRVRCVLELVQTVITLDKLVLRRRIVMAMSMRITPGIAWRVGASGREPVDIAVYVAMCPAVMDPGDTRTPRRPIGYLQDVLYPLQSVLEREEVVPRDELLRRGGRRAIVVFTSIAFVTEDAGGTRPGLAAFGFTAFASERSKSLRRRSLMSDHTM
jgi:hypothetical protein